jgi:hypothetical protein
MLQWAQSSIPGEQLFVINQSGVYLLFMPVSRATANSIRGAGSISCRN